ncbi:MAG: uroporphyrinogen-III synthase [Halioglobus sp.]|nr:uroporphyrinogen-III synthase [Halioglobus sp.]
MPAETSAARARVLVTRPAGQADALCAALAAAGCTARHQPLLELQPLPELSPQAHRYVLGLDRYRHIIFISANAVKFGMARIRAQWPQVPAGLQWYAVGDGTARELRNCGVEVVTPGAAMDSEGLLALPQLAAVAGERVLIVKGEGGRGALRQTLHERGAAVDELACYRRCRPLLGPGELAARLRQWQVNVVMISSGEGFANLQALLGPTETTELKSTVLIVPSQRVARAASAAGFEHVVTAVNASDAAMVQALEEQLQARGE